MTSATVQQPAIKPGQPPQYETVRFTPYGAARDLFYCRDLEVGLDGPAGTGKTVAALNKIHLALLKYPGARALLARKTNVDLAASAMVTFKNHVLHAGDGVVYFGGNRVKPPAFQYPNGSEAVPLGLDRPEKVKSNEYDLALINEATECGIEDVELVRSRLRNGVMPYQQLIMDMNPGAPTHWLNQRMHAGITTRLLSRHEDNPRYYDRERQVWTPEGELYVQTVLGGLTGVRYQRLALGKWVAAEGLVYDEWDAAVHVVPREQVMVRDAQSGRWQMPPAWPRYVVVDFGYTNPFVCHWYAHDPDGRLYLYRELYMTRRTVDVHAAEMLRLSANEPMPRAVICDSEDADGRAVITRVTRWGTIPAHKDIRNGIQALKARLLPAGDKKPRFFVVQGALLERDQALVAQKKPCGLTEEIDAYVWDTRNNRKHGEEPMPGDDHALDTARYATAYFDLAQTGVSYMPSFY